MVAMEIKDMLIDEECTILQTMERLDRTEKRVLFVADNGILKAAITDGDIRRWIMTKGNLDARVKDIANYDPKFAYEKDRLQADEYMKRYLVGAIPIVDENKRIISIAILRDTDIEPRKELNIPVVIMAGGFGKRLYPYTKILPKPLIPVGELPIAEHIINKFCAYGCRQFYLIVNHKKNMIKAYFNEIEKNYEITYIDEDKPLGTGGGLSLLKKMIHTTCILTNCDIIIEDDYEKIYQFHKDAHNVITMVCTLKNFTIPYGIVEIDENGEIDTIREKPQMSFFTNTGFYLLEPRVIEELEADQLIDFPEIIMLYKNAGEKVGIYPVGEHAWMDMGQLEEMEKMRIRLSGDE